VWGLDLDTSVTAGCFVAVVVVVVVVVVVGNRTGVPD